ncbi:MAG: hypothetical protein ACKOES_14530 [Planctomycetaceae bacterium]
MSVGVKEVLGCLDAHGHNQKGLLACLDGVEFPSLKRTPVIAGDDLFGFFIERPNQNRLDGAVEPRLEGIGRVVPGQVIADRIHNA